MARDVEADVNINDKSSSGLRSFLGNLRKTDDQVKATQKEIDKASAATGKFSKAADENTKSFNKLHNELAIARNELGSLARAFADAGTAAERMDISKAMRRQESEIRNLTKNADILKGLLPGKAEVSRFGKLLSGEISEALGTAGSSVGPILGAAAVGAAPFIGATISAAVIGGAAGLGIIGGTVLAARDPRVKAAGTELAQNLLGDLQRDAQPFIEPVLRNIEKVEIRFGQMDDRIERIFANTSGYLDPLTDGLLDGIDGVLRGVDKLAAKAGPVIEGFGNLFDRVGNATGDAFEVIAGGSDEAAQALDDVSRTIEFLVLSSGYAIRALTELYGVITYIPRKIGEAERALLGWEDETTAAATTTKALATVQAQMGKLVLSAGEAAGSAGQQMATYADKMADATEKGRGFYDSQTDVAQAVADAKKALDQNGKTLDINTEKGRANRRSLSDLAGSLTANYQAYVKLNGEGAGAAKVASDNRNSFVKLATQLGLTKTQAGNLATQMGLIPSKKSTDFYANTHDADGRVRALQDRINSVHDKTVTLSVSVGGTGRLAAVERTLGRLGGSGLFAADNSFAFARSPSDVSRTGGPTPVNVSADVTSRLYLDGSLVYANTARQIRAANDRAAWRQRVGKL